MILNVMERLKDDTLDHFAYEEQLMNQAGYVLLEAHPQVHRRLKDKTKKLEDSLLSGQNPCALLAASVRP
ncbi:MAG: hemerythrin family protein [Saccharospirillaceae bacterium]|nr:hypothetical protein A3759_11125 [Thalassolituus sp. HI0120]MCH2040966.1 hemerythrin family protein [Saccharospirillaceae bacterium]